MQNLIYLLAIVPFLAIASPYETPPGYELIPDDPYQHTLINGRAAETGEFPEIVQIRTGNALCTATLIGPRVILTAAHCADTGSTSRFTMDGEQFTAKMTRSPLYPNPDHDIALGFLNKAVSVKFASIGGTPGLSEKVILTGFGCTASDGTGSDGVLRVGESVVVGFDGYDFVTKRPDGAALCFGDSGGPSYVYMDDPFSQSHIFMGVNSKGNIIDTSLITRTDHPDSQEFLSSWSQDNNAEICGVNRDCIENPTQPPSCLKKFIKGMERLLEKMAGCTRGSTALFQSQQ